MGATAALDTLWNRIEVSFGDIISLIGEPRDAETSGEGLRVGLRSDFPFVGTYYQKVNIKFNTTWWLTSDTEQQLAGFIHEVGHAIALLSTGTITGGFVHSDRSPTVNADNDRKIRENCVNPLFR